MPASSPDRIALSAILEWYAQMGVDAAMGEGPANRFGRSQPSPVSPPDPARLAHIRDALAVPNAPSTDPADRLAAADAADLAALQAAFAQFEGCGLRWQATQLVFADGNPQAQIMIVGEAPGSEEDLQGKPFVGRAGQLLDRMLAAIGLDRTKVYIANTVPWRPPGNRAPTDQEIAACAPFLTRQIELVAPKWLVTMGNVPTQTLFGTSKGITRMRGQWQTLTIGAHTMPALATFHPAYLLRQPAQKAQAWRDLLSLKAAIETL